MILVRQMTGEDVFAAEDAAGRRKGLFHGVSGLWSVLLVAGIAIAAPAAAADRWEADPAAATTRLPDPAANDVVRGGALSCAEQKWSLLLEAVEGRGLTASNAALTVGKRNFELTAAAHESGLTLAVPVDAIEPLKAGLRMTVGIESSPDGESLTVAFPLRGSRVAITSAQQRCSLRDMTGYTPVTFTPYSSYMKLARELRDGDIKAFIQSTAIEPELSAAMAEFDEGRRVLFTRLCGSSWYFGASGCNITGFGHAGPEGDWRIVFDTENVHLYFDPKSRHGGWPDLATLPMSAAAGAGSVWRWEDRVYRLKGDLPDGPTASSKLRPSLD